jgi:hypothetical protein
MQISEVSLALIWPHRLCLLRVLLRWGRWHCTAFSGLHVCLQLPWEVGLPPLLWSFPPTAAFTSFPAPDYWAVLLLLPAAVFVYSSHGKWVFLLLLWSFPPSATLTSFPAPGFWAHTPAPAGASPPLLLEPLQPTRLVYLHFWEGFPSPNLWHSGHPTLFPASLYCSYCLLLSFSFFPRWRSVCPGGYADLAQACLREYCSTAKLTLSKSSQAVWVRASDSLEALLVSPLMWIGDALHQLEVWRGQSFVSSWLFCLQGVSPVSLQDFTIRGTLSASSL